MGWLVLIHSVVILGGAIAGACGYVQRKLWNDAIGVALTIGVAAIVEMIFSIYLIF